MLSIVISKQDTPFVRHLCVWNIHHTSRIVNALDYPVLLSVCLLCCKEWSRDSSGHCDLASLHFPATPTIYRAVITSYNQKVQAKLRCSAIIFNVDLLESCDLSSASNSNTRSQSRSLAVHDVVCFTPPEVHFWLQTAVSAITRLYNIKQIASEYSNASDLVHDYAQTPCSSQKTGLMIDCC